mmetsp:Transcript_21617/g.59310  ORF Transcript_21617/g.59310 Transcript_21617/m.59310 type:complete len:90 (-) Transcript_21617:163-432(-)
MYWRGMQSSSLFHICGIKNQHPRERTQKIIVKRIHPDFSKLIANAAIKCRQIYVMTIDRTVLPRLPINVLKKGQQLNAASYVDKNLRDN